jgi:hypothetical protein
MLANAKTQISGPNVIRFRIRLLARYTVKSVCAGSGDPTYRFLQAACPHAAALLSPCIDQRITRRAQLQSGVLEHRWAVGLRNPRDHSAGPRASSPAARLQLVREPRELGPGERPKVSCDLPSKRLTNVVQCEHEMPADQHRLECGSLRVN